MAWHDRDEPGFLQALADLVSRFQRTPSLAFSKGYDSIRHSMRLSILQATGVEESCVVELSDNSKLATWLRERIERLFAENPKLAVAAASQVILKNLSDGTER